MFQWNTVKIFQQTSTVILHVDSSSMTESNTLTEYYCESASNTSQIHKCSNTLIQTHKNSNTHKCQNRKWQINK